MDIYELEVKNLLEEGGNERLKSQFMNLSRRLDDISNENKELKKQISELESELSVKEDLLTIKSAIAYGLEDDVKIKCECPECGETFNAKLPCGYKLKEDLPFSGEDYLESLVDDLEKQRAKYQEKIYNLKISLSEMADLLAEQRYAEDMRWSRE